MAAMILQHQYYFHDLNDIIITNRSSDMDKRAGKIKETKLFRNVFFAETKACHHKTPRINYHIRQLCCEFSGCNINSFKHLPNDYQKVFSLDVSCLTNHVCHVLQKEGKLPEVHLFEEGFGCYTDMFNQHLFGFHSGRNLVSGISDMIYQRSGTMKLVKDISLFEPQLMRWKPPFNVKKIEKPNILADSKLMDTINFVFQYEKEVESFKEPIVFFEDCIFQDKGDNRDFGIIMDIAKYVGKNKMILKLHPRTEINRFEKAGIKTIKKQGMPWEVIAMNMNENDARIFVTIASSSVVTYSLLFSKSYHSILLFQCIKGFSGYLNPDILDFLISYSKERPDTLFIPETLDEALKKIDEWQL